MQQGHSRRALSLLDTPIDSESDALGQRLDTCAAALPNSLSPNIRQRLDLKAFKSGSSLSILCAALRILNSKLLTITIGRTQELY